MVVWPYIQQHWQHLSWTRLVSPQWTLIGELTTAQWPWEASYKIYTVKARYDELTLSDRHFETEMRPSQNWRGGARLWSKMRPSQDHGQAKAKDQPRLKPNQHWGQAKTETQSKNRAKTKNKPRPGLSQGLGRAMTKDNRLRPKHEIAEMANIWLSSN